LSIYKPIWNYAQNQMFNTLHSLSLDCDTMCGIRRSQLLPLCVCWSQTHTHTHTHTRLTALCLGLPGCASTRKVKPIWILLKQETVSGSSISWAVCKSAPSSRQISTPAPHHSVFTDRVPFLPPNQQRESTEGNLVTTISYAKMAESRCRMGCGLGTKEPWNRPRSRHKYGTFWLSHLGNRHADTSPESIFSTISHCTAPNFK